MSDTYAFSKTGLLAREVAAHHHVQVHEMLRGPGGIRARRELCFRLHHELGWPYGSIDREWGFAMGTAAREAVRYVPPKPTVRIEPGEVVDRRHDNKPPALPAWDEARRKARALRQADRDQRRRDGIAAAKLARSAAPNSSEDDGNPGSQR